MRDLGGRILKELCLELVNTPEGITSLSKASEDDFVSGKKVGGAARTRTPDSPCLQSPVEPSARYNLSRVWRKVGLVL